MTGRIKQSVGGGRRGTRVGEQLYKARESSAKRPNAVSPGERHISLVQWYANAMGLDTGQRIGTRRRRGKRPNASPGETAALRE